MLAVEIMEPQKEEAKKAVAKLSPKTKRQQKAKLYSFNRALRNNGLLNEELQQSQRQLMKHSQRNNQLTNHIKTIMTMNTKHVSNTSTWMNNHLSRCFLVLERGRHMQAVKPYFHGPGKPLTPYQKKKERERLAQEAAAAREVRQNKGVFLEFKEPRRFSAVRDNCQVVQLNKKLGSWNWTNC